MPGRYTIHQHDVTQPWPLADGSVQCIVTSPPYWGLRDYGVPGQLGLESTPDEYGAKMVGVFREARRVLRDDGTLWLNLGDSYAGARSEGGGTMAGFNDRYFGRDTNGGKQADVDTSKPARAAVVGLKPKDLIGIPWRVAFALQADGWYLRSDIIWAKPNPMPESVTDRPTKAHEYLFLMSKRARYYYDAEAIREPISEWNNGKISVAPHGDHVMDEGHRKQEIREYAEIKGANRRSVWTVPTEPFPEAHFATFPTALVDPCIKAGSKEGDTVLDPFAGSGTTLMVACRLNRNGVGLELNPTYIEMARRRIHNDSPLLNVETK